MEFVVTVKRCGYITVYTCNHQSNRHKSAQ